MLYWLGGALEAFYGPFRLLRSDVVLAAVGLAVGSALTGYLLPRFLARLPNDRGRQYAVDGDRSIGKPTGAGIVFVPLFILTALLVVPWTGPLFAVLFCVFFAALTGFLDDRSDRPWGDYRKASLDLGISLLVAWILCRGHTTEIWLPIFHGDEPFVVSPWLYVPLATVLLWISINTTNCTDGVDGLSGSLLMLALVYLGAVLYLVIGNPSVAGYLLIPYYVQGVQWSILAFTLLGTLAGYLWHNAQPSRVLMGDAGSRPLGLLLGVLVLATGNPFMIFVVAGVVLVNGGAGLVKVALLRFFKIGILRSIRFPLHDHCRRELGWSNTQVLMRFMLLQALLTPVLIVLLLKVR